MTPPRPPLRLLVILPTWVGDAVMATPTLQHLRNSLPATFIGALTRPPVDQLLDGLDCIDEIHTAHPHGMMAPKRAAAAVRGRNYDTALLLTNSFSTALAARMAFIPRRIGYSRDARAMLLTQTLTPPRSKGSFTIVPAVDYYYAAAQAMLTGTQPELAAQPLTDPARAPLILPADVSMTLALTDRDRADADRTLESAGVGADEGFALLNPGGNNTAKRWPAERFAELAHHLANKHQLRSLINGSPAEAELCSSIAATVNASRDDRFQALALPEHRSTLRGLKALAARARIMITNDTGPRHIAAAFGIPTVSLFGPTDARWTTIPHARERIVLADPTLPPDQSANDHPDRCAIEHIGLSSVSAAVDELLEAAG